MFAVPRRIFILSVSAVVMLLLGASAASAATRFVGPSGGIDTGNGCLDQWEPCATIQHAIDEAVAWDTVMVRGSGTYTENLTIDKRLTLSGPNPGQIENRDPEVIIDGGSGTAVTPEADNVVIEGFTLTAAEGGYGVRTAGADIDGLKLQMNVIEGGAAGIELGAGGKETSIWGNAFGGSGSGVVLSGTAYADLELAWNRFPGILSPYGVFADGGTTIENLEMEGNRLEVPSEIRGVATGENLMWGNEFDLDSPGDVALKIRARKSRLMENEFHGHGASGCLQLLGSQPGLSPSEKVHISGNTFRQCNPYGIELGPKVDAMTIFFNKFPGSHDGIRISNATPWNVSEEENLISHNRIVGTTGLGVRNLAAGTIDAANNWWGCNAGPNAPGCDGASSGVDSWPHVILTGTAYENFEEWDPPVVTALNPGEKAVIVARLQFNSAGAYTAGVPVEGDPVGFSAASGSITPTSAGWWSGQATASFWAGSQPGPAGIKVTFENQQVEVPLTIRGSLPSSPPPPGPSLISPRVRRTSATLAGVGRRPTLARIYCGSSTCHPVARTPVVKIAGKKFQLKIKLPDELAAGSEAPIRGILPKAVLRHLAKGKTGRVRVVIEVTDATGQKVIQTIRVAIS